MAGASAAERLREGGEDGVLTPSWDVSRPEFKCRQMPELDICCCMEAVNHPASRPAERAESERGSEGGKQLGGSGAREIESSVTATSADTSLLDLLEDKWVGGGGKQVDEEPPWLFPSSSSPASLCTVGRALAVAARLAPDVRPRRVGADALSDAVRSLSLRAGFSRGTAVSGSAVGPAGDNGRKPPASGGTAIPSRGGSGWRGGVRKGAFALQSVPRPSNAGGSSAAAMPPPPESIAAVRRGPFSPGSASPVGSPPHGTAPNALPLQRSASAGTELQGAMADAASGSLTAHGGKEKGHAAGTTLQQRKFPRSFPSNLLTPTACLYADGGVLFLVSPALPLTLQAVLRHSPSVLQQDELAARVLGMGLLNGVAEAHARGLACGGLTPASVLLTEDLWPVIVVGAGFGGCEGGRRRGGGGAARRGVYEGEAAAAAAGAAGVGGKGGEGSIQTDRPQCTSEAGSGSDGPAVHTSSPTHHHHSSSTTATNSDGAGYHSSNGPAPLLPPPLSPASELPVSLEDAVQRWVRWDMSNLEYLLLLNRLAGRRAGDRHFPAVVPWVMDFTQEPEGLEWSRGEEEAGRAGGNRIGGGSEEEAGAEECGEGEGNGEEEKQAALSSRSFTDPVEIQGFRMGGAAGHAGTSAGNAASLAARTKSDRDSPFFFSTFSQMAFEAALPSLTLGLLGDPPPSIAPVPSPANPPRAPGGEPAPLTSAGGSPGWRDLTRSKWRLAKGDEQLDFSYHSSEVPHHVAAECVSDVAVCVYTARVLPLWVLRRVVRTVFEPNEYPSTLTRLYR